MTDEELEAEAVEIAVEAGFDPAAAAADPYSALRWVEEQMRARVDAMPADGQADFIARHGDPRKRPSLWPKRRLGGMGAERQS